MSHWRYEPPYEIYSLTHPPSPAEVAYLLEPAYAYHQILDYSLDEGLDLALRMAGFCSFGEDGQVPGGDYSADGLDIGMGVRPDLTGQGYGHLFVDAVCGFALQQFEPAMLRVTVAEFNTRALRVWQKKGFREVQRFGRSSDGMRYVILCLNWTYLGLEVGEDDGSSN